MEFNFVIVKKGRTRNPYNFSFLFSSGGTTKWRAPEPLRQNHEPLRSCGGATNTLGDQPVRKLIFVFVFNDKIYFFYFCVPNVKAQVCFKGANNGPL